MQAGEPRMCVCALAPGRKQQEESTYRLGRHLKGGRRSASRARSFHSRSYFRRRESRPDFSVPSTTSTAPPSVCAQPSRPFSATRSVSSTIWPYIFQYSFISSNQLFRRTCNSADSTHITQYSVSHGNRIRRLPSFTQTKTHGQSTVTRRRSKQYCRSRHA